MDYFTVEIAGKPIACFRSETQEDADHLFRAADFREDLTALESEGKPLWDGEAALSLRKATPEERREVDEAYDFDEDAEKDADAEFIVFLVDITDPEEDPTED
jgi:hypothetical protein